MLPPLPAAIPNDPNHPSRPTHTVQVLEALARAGLDFTPVQVAQSLLLAPLNLRFFKHVLGNFRRLHTHYLSVFSQLSEDHQEALQKTLDTYDLIMQINDPLLIEEFSKSPRESQKGNLGYSTNRHPLYSLLMLEHPHPTSSYFDLLMTVTLVQCITLRENFEGEAYRQYIHPDSRLEAPCPQPFHHTIVAIEQLGRQITGSTTSDPFVRLSENAVPLEVPAILEFFRNEKNYNGHSKEAMAFAAHIENFLKKTIHTSRKNHGRRVVGRQSIRHGLNIGTLLAGDLTMTPSELHGADLISVIDSQTEQIATDLDMAPEEIITNTPTLLLNLGIGASLPASARTALSRHIANQLARAQQLMITRTTGLRAHRLAPIKALLKNTDLSPEVALLLRASLATGRPLNALEKMVITRHASIHDANETIEFDITRGTWRITINTPRLRRKNIPQNARMTSNHAELPDVVGATPIATHYHQNKSPHAERLTLKWTPQDHDQAKAFLNDIHLESDYLGKVLPMALYESSGDLATGALISQWLPNSCETYLHYLTVDRVSITEKYWTAAKSLQSRLDLPLPAEKPPIEAGFVGMPNCPEDSHMQRLVSALIHELNTLPITTRADRARYINLLSCYTVLYLTQGLGLRNSIDPDPAVAAMPSMTEKLGLAIFEDKRVTDAHIRVLYCPADLATHMAGLKHFSARIQQEFPAKDGKEAPGLLPFIIDNANSRRFHPSDIQQILGDRFNFMPNALRRRARSYLYDYSGPDAASLGHGFSAWMGHWPEANNPHRHESNGLRESLYKIAHQIITHLLEKDGWRPVLPQV